MRKTDEIAADSDVPEGEWSQRDYQDQADFRCAVRRFVRFAEEQAREKGITPQQHVLLVVVRGHASYPRVGIGEIARALQVRQSSASLLVDRCVRRGLLSRREDVQDRRRAVVSLTEEGQRILDEIMAANRRELGALREALFRESFLSAIRTIPD
ncbi:MAG TPA: MarR family transcriptional regulator [Chloroflexota bacterium]|nr:MarR family transcriptional regulator [Chloroflexota bacterium]